MSLRTWVASRVMDRLTGVDHETKVRAAAERTRAGGPHVIEYFHQVDDPYSHLAVQALARIESFYDVVIVPHLVGPPADWAAPERERLQAYARADVQRLSARHGLALPLMDRQPDQEQIDAANTLLVSSLASDHFFAEAQSVGEKLWSGVRLEHVHHADSGAAIAAGEARRESNGHFMSAMLYYGREWYWGVDRLHYLEQRLMSLGAREAGALLFPCPMELEQAPTGSLRGETIEFFLSFRSPYTWLAVPRVKALADAWGAELRLRYVLPMVMRGLPVPRMKGLYFARDAAREARRLGLPFGRIADPVGRPVELGYSLFPMAEREGKGYAWCEAFMRAAWSEGVDAGSMAGLREIATQARLDWQRAREHVDSPEWRPIAEVNREAMFALGHWGVPCFRIRDVAVWGQDRLWVIDEALRRIAVERLV